MIPANHWPAITEIADKVKSGELKASELVEKSLKLIDENKDYNAIISTTAERARERAKEIDSNPNKASAGQRMAGVPFIAKDNFLAFGAETTAASNILKGFVAPYQSTAIERLEAEGAICVAKANMDAFGHGSSTENSDFGVVKNPYDKSRVPGGSSGGSATAVALGMAPFALGTDTGSSIRIPAAYCGLVGHKPTYGLVSRSGVISMGSSLDTIGPLARTVDDAALVLDIISGRDDLDSTTIDKESEGYLNLNTDLKGKKIGIIKEHMGEGLSHGVRQQVEAAIDKIKQAGVEVSEISLPTLDLSLAIYYIICPAEISSNLSRYDGQRYGHSYKEAKDLEESYRKSRGQGFGAEAKRRIMIGTYVLSSGYYDAYYKKAQTVRTKLINEFNDVFKEVDFLLGPTTPGTAFKIGEHKNPLHVYMTDIMTVAANLAGVPAISLPCGMSDNLPVGLQIMAPQHHDRELLGLSKKVEELLK